MPRPLAVKKKCVAEHIVNLGTAMPVTNRRDLGSAPQVPNAEQRTPVTKWGQPVNELPRRRRRAASTRRARGAGPEDRERRVSLCARPPVPSPGAWRGSHAARAAACTPARAGAGSHAYGVCVRDS